MPAAITSPVVGREKAADAPQLVPGATQTRGGASGWLAAKSIAACTEANGESPLLAWAARSSPVVLTWRHAAQSSSIAPSQSSSSSLQSSRVAAGTSAMQELKLPSTHAATDRRHAPTPQLN